MSAIILPQNPRVHHDLLPDILSHTITHILKLGLPRVEIRSHLASALHAVPPGVTHQSQNNVKVTLRLLDRQLAPRRHHRDLIDHLRHHLESLHAHQGESNIRNSLTTACQPYLQQLPSRQDDRVVDHRILGDSSSSFSSTSSSDLQHQLPHLHIGMISLKQAHERKDKRMDIKKNNHHLATT